MNARINALNAKVRTEMETIHEKACNEILKKHGKVVAEDLKEILASLLGLSISGTTSTTEASGPATGCPYLFTKGAHAGEACGVGAKKGLTVLCSKHTKSGSKTPSVASATKEPLDTSTSSAPAPRLTLRMNKDLNRLWHSKTKMVFDSKENKTVIGIAVKGEIHDLSDEDIATCEANGFKYDANRIKKLNQAARLVEDDLDELNISLEEEDLISEED